MMIGKYKQTSTGEMPEDWEVVNLGDEEFCTMIMGQSPPSSTYNENNKGLPFLQGNMEFGKIYPSPTIYCSAPLKLAQKNDILISVRAPVGEVNISPSKLCIGRGLAAIRCKTDRMVSLFLFYLLKHENRKLDSISSGSTFKAVRKVDLEKFELALPPLPKQKAIAQVLSTVDDAIQKVDEIIAKTERLKKGLMQKLLDNEKWEFEHLSNDNYFKIIMGQSPPSNTYNLNKGGLPFYQGNADFGELYPRPRVYCNSPVKIAEEGDILISVRAPVGELNIADQKCCIGRGLGAVRVLEGNNLFYFYFLNHIKTMIQNLGQGSTFKAITGAELQRIKLPIPNLEEQRKIASILSTVDQKLELERKRKGKLERVKKGLMDDLLTGRKRVKVKVG